MDCQGDTVALLVLMFIQIFLSKCATPPSPVTQAADCDFEAANLCNYIQDNADTIDWTRQAGKTDSLYTGPDADHTYSTKSGHYMYIETSWRRIGGFARLWSPELEPVDSICISFWYHMYGKDIASLKLYAVPVSNTPGPNNQVWYRMGPAGKKWIQQYVELSSPSKFHVVFEAVVGTSYYSDIAIDDVKMVAVCPPEDSPCEAVNITNGNYDPPGASFSLGSTITYTCNLGYVNSSGHLRRECYPFGSFTNTLPTCSLVKCTKPNTPAHATIIPDVSDVNYNTSITYVCDPGYNRTDGDGTRRCTENAKFEGVEAKCTLVKCTKPNTPAHATIIPDVSDVNYNTSITYVCDPGYNRTDGDGTRRCTENAKFEGVEAKCTLVKCTKPNTPAHATIIPDVSDVNYNTSITYVCDPGYNRTDGDGKRRCTENATFEGVEAKCTQITCYQPDSIPNASFTPVLAEYNWNTSVHYFCNPSHHYVSGDSTTTCDDNGIFPQVDLDCSAKHYLHVDSSEPPVTWLNVTVLQTDEVFYFDNMCEVRITCEPDLLDIIQTIGSHQITIHVAVLVNTVYGEYVCSLFPIHDERAFPTVKREVFFGEKISGFETYLDHYTTNLIVGETYTFFAYAKTGSAVYLDWEMEMNTTEEQFYLQLYNGSLSYTFQKPRRNITVTARNLISSQKKELSLNVFYEINNIEFTVENNLGSTSEPIQFDIHLLPTASLPIGSVNITIDFKHGGVTTESIMLDENYGVNVSHFYDHLFDIPGTFLVEARVENYFSHNTYNITINIWDSLLLLQFKLVSNIRGKYIITNSTAVFDFINTPNYGFKYYIDYGDGTGEWNNDDNLLHNKYDLSEFMHVYSSPGVYTVRWTANNGEQSYDRDEQFTVHVQTKVPDTGYTLEPLGKKYPWSFVHDFSIEINITLNSEIPLPTNATCVFDPNDGNNPVNGLIFDDYVFIYFHDYRTDGLFNSTLNCSNAVSSYLYIFDVEVRKFQASELTLVFHEYVPMNVSEAALVYFHINNGGYAVLPKDVYITMDFGDGSIRAPILYDKSTLSHLYSGRGNYTVSVFVEAHISNTTDTKAYSLRLGIMFFDYNTTVQFLDTTVVRYNMYGVAGTTSYTIDFDDGTPNEQCSSSGPSGCYIFHLCPTYGYHLVQVVANNGTFIEVDNMNMTCDNPIVNITTDIPYTVEIPNGTIEAKLRIKEEDMFLPWLSCFWNMGDPIKRATYGPISNQVTYEDPFLFKFQYIALGRHTITVHCRNLINDTRLETQIVVTNKDFLFTGVFDRFYSQESSPLYLSSMIDIEVFSRLEIVASHDEKSHTNFWQLNASIGETKLNRHSLLFTRGLISEIEYCITLQVCFVEEPENCIFEPTYVEFVRPPPHAEIVGSTRRYVSRGAVRFDAYTTSFDPVSPASTNLYYNWSCKSFSTTSFDVGGLDIQEAGSDCTFKDTHKGVILVNTSAEPVNSHYAVTVTVENKKGMAASFTQIVEVQTFQQLTIKCLTNCLSKVARSSILQLMPDLPNNCRATFFWTLKKYSDLSFRDMDLANITTDAGFTARSLIIKENTLEYGTRYLVSVKVTVSNVVYGPAYYEFLTNRPPQGGFCTVIQYDEAFAPTDKEIENTTISSDEYKLTAGKDIFNISCQDWEDEGFTVDTFSNREPMFYVYFLAYDDDENGEIKRQLVYFDPGQTSNLVSFQAGNIKNSYRATIVLRISDVFGDYTEVLYNVKSEPSLTTEHLVGMNSDGIVAVVAEYIEQFDDALIKANRTYDYRTISRKVIDIASVYNALSLNTSSGIELTSEDILTLGHVKTEENVLLKWEDYWKTIVEVQVDPVLDYLKEISEKYAYMLHASVTTWPSNRRMTLVAIETISRALHEVTLNMHFTSLTVAELSAECADVFARSLADISNDRTLTNTDQLFFVSKSVLALIENILAILKATLTPNLPEDPSVDEMRQFLEYVKVFKETENVLNTPLSLQEQTFLAQKQLQKYNLQKYIKAEASKTSLPSLMFALKNLTVALARLTSSGQDEFYLKTDSVFISTEVRPTLEFAGKTIKRPRVALVLNDIYADDPDKGNASEVVAKTIVFQSNPFFWGQFGDRITSYVPLFQIDGASLGIDEITYILENKIEAECKDQVPTYEEGDPEKMIYILFDRRHAEDDILIFVRPNTSELVYKLYFNKGEKPKIAENLYSYSTEMKKNDASWTSQDGYKLLIKSKDYAETGKIWIGLQPLLDISDDESLLTRHFCANVTSVSCLALRETNGKTDFKWDSNYCEVSLSSTRTDTVCRCKHTSDFVAVGTTSYIPYNMIDFKALKLQDNLLGRSPVIGMMIATVCVYCVLVFWAWREDTKDYYKWSYATLIDNDIADSYFYILRVFTGLRANAGTTSKIAFVLVGEENDTNVRILDDENHTGFERGSVRTFVMSTRKHLGELLSMRIWHDDSGGNTSSWYLNKVTVTDLKKERRYAFDCNNWFDYDSGVDHVITAIPYDEFRSYKDMIVYTVAENHLWISLVFRPLKSNFTRIQRLSCLLGLIYLIMILCTILIEAKNSENTSSKLTIGPFRFSMDGFKMSLMAVFIASIIISIVSFFFKYAESSSKTPNADSLTRKVYRKLNKKLKLDNSELARRTMRPVEKALEHNVYFLPHISVYVGWIILVSILILASYLLVSFTSEWTTITSEEWVTSVLVAMIGSFLLIESAKVVVILSAFTLMCQRAYEPVEPYIDIDSLEEITRSNSATLLIGPHFASILQTPKQPTKVTLLKNEMKRVRNHQLLKIVLQLAGYTSLLFMVYTISYESRDSRSFQLKHHIEHVFNFKSEVQNVSDKQLDEFKVSDLKSYTDWLKGTFLFTYFSNTFFGKEYDGNNNKMYMQDLSNFRIGPARLRQMRIRQEDCLGPLGVNLTCHNKYEESKKETEDFCLGWQRQPCPVTEKSTYFTSSAWVYTSSDEVWGLPTEAQYCTYGGGGYFMKLDVNQEVSKKIFDELEQFSWFDEQTRAVILEFTLYNANTNLFIYSKLVAEFPEVGGFLSFTDIQVFRLYLNAGTQGEFILFLQFFFFLVVVAATFLCAYEMCTDFKAFFKSLWNILDLVALIMCYITISIFCYKIFIVKTTIELFKSDKNAYVGFENLAFYDFITNTAYGILVFLLSIRVSRILGYSGKINEMADVVSNASSDLYGFLFVFAISYFAYVMCGTLLFGKEQEKYKDLFQTYGTLTEAIVGKNRVSNILMKYGGFAEFYYITFVLFVLMTLTTMAAAILNFSISAVKREQQNIASPSIIEVVFDRLGQLINRIASSTDNARDTERMRRRSSETELNDILADLRAFFNGARMKKLSSKYKLRKRNRKEAQST